MREKISFGNQVDYFDDPNCIGWVLTGDYEHELSGLAVVMTNAQGAEKEMTISAIHGGETYVDILKNNEAKSCLRQKQVKEFSQSMTVKFPFMWMNVWWKNTIANFRS